MRTPFAHSNLQGSIQLSLEHNVVYDKIVVLDNSIMQILRDAYQSPHQHHHFFSYCFNMVPLLPFKWTHEHNVVILLICFILEIHF